MQVRVLCTVVAESVAAYRYAGIQARAANETTRIQVLPESSTERKYKVCGGAESYEERSRSSGAVLHQV